MEPIGMVVWGRRRWWHRIPGLRPKAKIYRAGLPDPAGMITDGGRLTIEWDSKGEVYWRIPHQGNQP